MKILRLGILSSHGGSNLQAIIGACKEGRLDAEISVIISNNSGSMALERARRDGIPSVHISTSTHPKYEDLDLAMLNALQEHGVNLVVLAGFMKKLGPRTLFSYRNRILNIHPALLPRFGGKGMFGKAVHEAVLSSGEKMTGVTIHIVDDRYDHGPIIAQCLEAIREDDNVDSLSERVLSREHVFLVETLAKISRGEIILDRPAPLHEPPMC